MLLAFLAIGCLAEAQDKPALVASQDATTPTTSSGRIAHVFVSVLPEVKAKTRIPVLLPDKLPKAIGSPKHATVKAAEKRYWISLYYELDVGDAGFAADFGADADPKFSPRELPNIHEVKLAHGILGFFRPISCGGSCAPVNLWWKEGGVLYQIQLDLSSGLSERSQQKTITGVANSSILAGPR